MSTAEVSVVTADKTAVGSIQAAMIARGANAVPGVYGTLGELRTRLSRVDGQGSVSVALVDIDHETDRVLADLGKVTAANPDVRFMVLSTGSSEALILQAMQAGARHFLHKQTLAQELDAVLEHLLAHRPSSTVRSGSVISVFSCSGGCGATTVAVNLANELRLLSSQPVLIVDLDQHYGSVATYLGLSGRYGVAHILSRGDAIDGHLIRTGATGFAEGLDVLLSPVAASEDLLLPMHWENLGRTIEACREPYRYVIVDAPRLPQHMGELATLSRLAVVVLQLTVRDISFAKSTIAALRNRGVMPDKILPLANRANGRGPSLRLKEGKNALGVESLCSVRSDWRKATRSVTQGQPLASVARRSRLRHDFRRLAMKIHQEM